MRGAIVSASSGALLALVALVACALACTDDTTQCVPQKVDASYDAATCRYLSINSTCECCVQASCSSQAAAALGPYWASLDFAGSPCADLLACYCACDQTDPSCVSRCESTDAGLLAGACMNALSTLADCQKRNCGLGCSTANFDAGNETSGD